jgi:sigma-B regulation protein RsbU (phosphoserine phosphatase)
VAVVVADVSGKGLPAALLMASLQALVRSNSARYQEDLAGLMRGLNTSLYELTARNRFATLFFGMIDTANRTLDYVNAGHNPPLLFRYSDSPGPAVELLDHGGLPLGVLPASEYQSQQVALRDRDVLVVYTDGVSETRNPAGEEFGEERLRETLAGVLSRPAAEIQEHVRTRLREFSGQAPLIDDLTLLVAKIRFNKDDNQASDLVPVMNSATVCG